MWTTFVILVLTAASMARTEIAHCPPMVCSCQERSANCSKRGLIKLPPGLPVNLRNLDLSQNDMESMNTTMILSMSDLEVLDLSSNRMSQLLFLGTHYRLRKLDLSSNQFTTVRSLQIESLIHLTELNLSNNKIMSLPSNAFPGGSFLRTLNLKNNQLGFLDETCMSSLTSLETLILTRNFLSSFPKGLFKQMKSLLVLEVNKNKFVEIQGLTFHGLENLKVLRLKRNQIEFLMDGAFFGLTNIEEISLDRNKINRVNKGWLYGLNTLRYLSLSQNNVDFVDKDAWEFCTALDELDLRSNKLQLLYRQTLSRLPSLRHLYLQDNKISHIDGNGYEGRTFADVPLLETLALDGNEISHTIEDMEAPFDGLAKLKTLSLSNNLIKSIGNRAFLGLNSLEKIDVRDNVISTVQKNAFENLPRLQSILLNSESILCDCYLKWFPKWLNETSGFHREKVTATCAHPELLKGQYITYIPYESYTCDDFPKPYILKHPQNQVTLLGDSLKLSCRAASTSPADMKFEWKRDSNRVDAEDASPECASEDCIQYFPHSFDGKGREITSTLQLTNLTYDDAGRYQCVVQNEYGVTYSERANVTVYVYPTFVATPEDIEVEANSSARMECAAHGNPAPIVSWTKDFGRSNFTAALERRIKTIQPNDDKFTSINSFVMQDVKGEDTGDYTCTAKNPAGAISWNISLIVLDAPRFVKPMKDVNVTQGDNAVIECLTEGLPRPKLTWFKDGINLEMTQRHFFAADSQILLITVANFSDSGLYQCTVSNRMGSETQSSFLSVNVKPSRVIPSISGDPQGQLNIIIVTVVCGIMIIIMIMVVYMMCKRHQRHAVEHTIRTSFSGHGKADHEFTVPFSPAHAQRPLVVANQYTTSDHRRSSGNSDFKIDTSVSASQVCVNPQLSVVDPTRIVIQDSSSERDSGTGDSRKSRDNLDDEDVVDNDQFQPLSPLLMPNLPARNGGGESTVSLTEFEDTNLTHLDCEDLEEDDEETGCGEAMLSASNSIASDSDDTSTVFSESGDQALQEQEVSFRTFHPKKSLSRDFLNTRPPPPRPMPRTNPLKKRSSAIELNGQKHLEIEVERTDESQQHPLDPVAYRGGLPMSSTPFNKGLEVNEKLLEYSLNSTDYSLHETKLVRNGRPDFVNSLPRRKQSRRKRGQTRKDPKEELYTTVPLKDDKMF